MWFALLFSACQEPAKDSDTGSLPVGQNPVVLEDANNFTYSGDLNVSSTDVQPMTDIRIEWPNVTVDMLGHPMAPTDVELVRLIVFRNTTIDEIETGLATESLDQADISLYVTCSPEGRTYCDLSEFGLGGVSSNIQNYLIGESGYWLIALTRADVQGALMMRFMEPLTGSTATTFTLENESCSLGATVTWPETTYVEPNNPALTVDWSRLTRDGVGNQINIYRLDRLQVFHYEETLDELQDQFFDLELIAEEQWELALSGESSADLSGLTGDTPFNGISDEGTWLFGLRCSSCENPVPHVLSVFAAGSTEK